MSIESLKKYIHPDANPNLTLLQKLSWYLCVSYPFLIFIISGSFALLIYFTRNDNTSISLSNVGFGMLIALSSVCFSYHRILQAADYIRLHHDVQKAGELFLTSAIAFILSSALKYAYFVLTPGSFLYEWFGFVFRTSYWISFFSAEVICIFGLAKLIDVLHIRITSPAR
ncbi:hypothetical protein ACFOWA_00110 [Pedobacter lithocola]|uniref:Uncharacterized protein n=1 Tax=Pedobacter lithocola TaxID=1908239 RepID=A0ABV8P2Q9_9SPHI